VIAAWISAQGGVVTKLGHGGRGRPAVAGLPLGERFRVGGDERGDVDH